MKSASRRSMKSRQSVGCRRDGPTCVHLVASMLVSGPGSNTCSRPRRGAASSGRMASLEIFTASHEGNLSRFEVFLVLLHSFSRSSFFDLPFSKTVMFLSLRRA